MDALDLIKQLDAAVPLAKQKQDAANAVAVEHAATVEKAKVAYDDAVAASSAKFQKAREAYAEAQQKVAELQKQLNEALGLQFAAGRFRQG